MDYSLLEEIQHAVNLCMMSKDKPALLNALATGPAPLSAWLLYGAVLTVAAWIVALPLTDRVAEATMRRMHLASDSFATWAPQQIAPAMYSFENRGMYSSEDVAVSQFTAWDERPGHFFNHFPVRSLTWTRREQFWPTGVWGYYRTRFQGRELLTKYRLEPWRGEGWHLIRVETEFSNSHD